METSVMNGMCRCCASEGAFKDVKSSYHWMGQEEVYGDMLRECFDISLSISEGEQGSICELCITQLRNAVNFKKQVLHTEDQFKTQLQNKLFKPSIVKVELPADDINDSGDNLSADEDYSGPEFEVPIKTETPDEPKVKKRAAKATTSRAKRAKTNAGETSTKREHQPATELKIKDPEVAIETKIEIVKIENIAKKLSTINTTKDVQTPGKVTKKNVTKVAETVVKPVKKLRTITITKQPDNGDSVPNNKRRKNTVTLNKNPYKKLSIITIPKPSIVLVEKKSNTLGSTSKAKQPDLRKHHFNIKEIMLWSNATPIRNYSGIGYTCCYCDEQYPEAANLKTHTINTHQDVTRAYFLIDPKYMMYKYVVKLDITSLRCKLCDDDINTLEQLLEHLKSVHKKMMYTDINNHILPFKFDSDTLRCFMCMNVFGKFKVLHEHMNIHYRNFICEVCDAGFVNYMGLQRHLYNHKYGKFTCKYCSKVFNTHIKMKVHERIHTGVGMNKCHLCNETFKEYCHKEKHLVEVHGASNIEVKCQLCDKVCSNWRKLNAHVKSFHLLEKNHKCQECDMSFSTPSGLRNHMVKHTGAREYKCGYCDKSFGRKSNLAIHQRIHEGDRRYKCKECGLAFVQGCSLKWHMRSKHGDKV